MSDETTHTITFVPDGPLLVNNLQFDNHEEG